MSQFQSKRTWGGERKDHYRVVTDQIIRALEKGVAPWIRPWDASLGLPRNGRSGHVYEGINVWVCWASGHSDPRWYTFKQVQEYGASHVRRGEKGTHIVKWLFRDKPEKYTDDDGNEQTRFRRVPVLLTYVVFNHEQIEWEAGKEPKVAEHKPVDPKAVYEAAEAFMKGTGAHVTFGSPRACYHPAIDLIEMPLPAAFDDAGAYYSTGFHEVGHWTGSKKRLARDLTGRFGDQKYAAEELVAELVSAFLCEDFEIKGHLQHPEYVGNWLKVLGGDKYAIFSAARLAREAVAFLRHEPPKEQPGEGEPMESSGALDFAA